MSENPEAGAPAGAERRYISCPGCGRHDTVIWPQGQETYHRKCFNCGKEYDLHRKNAH